MEIIFKYDTDSKVSIPAMLSTNGIVTMNLTMEFLQDLVTLANEKGLNVEVLVQ
jgi:hypothetical protein